MTKKQLEETVLIHAEVARKILIEQHGSYRQQAAIIDLHSTCHWIVLGNTVLHGQKMAGLLASFARSFGGADAILVMADARVKIMDRSGLDKVSAAAQRGEYIIADDPTSQEVLISRRPVAGAHGHLHPTLHPEDGTGKTGRDHV